jgi:penicillin-binding protein 2
LSNQSATPGQNLVLSIDIRLQQMVEDLFGQRRGALVALDPKSGEVLAFVSKPTFDPNLFVEGIDTESWKALNESIDKPLLNRALRGTYPPGSTYKPFMALGALELGKRKPEQIIVDNGSWVYGGHTFRSHGDGGLGPVNMVRAIALSSNVYFYALANDMGVDAIHDFMQPLGFGQITGIDLPGEVRGILPSTTWKRNTYKKPEQQRWYGGETISLGIGQGYNTFSMLQLATATATLANGGTQYKPRLLKATQDPVTRQFTNASAPEGKDLGYQTANIDVVRRGLMGVVNEGTATQVFRGAGYQSAGKTGTAQAVTIGQKEHYNAAKLAERQRDHALYMAFAPAEDPKIVVAVVVENAGFGAVSAAPIARRVFDYWLMGQYPSQADLQATRQGLTSVPVGTPRMAAEIEIQPRDANSGK